MQESGSTSAHEKCRAQNLESAGQQLCRRQRLGRSAPQKSRPPPRRNTSAGCDVGRPGQHPAPERRAAGHHVSRPWSGQASISEGHAAKVGGHAVALALDGQQLAQPCLLCTRLLCSLRPRLGEPAADTPISSVHEAALTSWCPAASPEAPKSPAKLSSASLQCDSHAQCPEASQKLWRLQSNDLCSA